MRKVWPLLCCVLMLCGCGAQETWETVEDDILASVSPPAAITVSLPEEAVTSAMEGSDGSKLYLCDGYSVSVQTFSNKQIDTTLKEITGFSPEKLTVIHTNTADMDQYSCAWSAAGEGTDQVCRTLILDDGTYHYAVTVMADQQSAGKLEQVWKTTVDSVALQY